MTVEIPRTPVLYLSHGAPPLADDRIWTAELAAVSAGIAKPTAILIVSAHWEAAPLTLAATETVPLLYDFWASPIGTTKCSTRPRVLRRSPTRCGSY